MGVPGGAVGGHQRRLAGSPRPPGALGVVGRGGRHVAETDRVEAGDVHPELHGRGAIEQWEGAVAEVALAVLALVGRHLGGVLLGVEPGQAEGDVAVQVPEERVDPGHGLTLEPPAQGVVRALRPVAADPPNGRSPQPVALRAVGIGRHLGEGAHVIEGLEEVNDHRQCFLGGQVTTKGPRAAQVAPVGGATRHVEVRAGAAGAARSREYGADQLHALAVRDGPRLAEVLAGVSLDALEPQLGEAVNIDGQHPAQLVEEDPGKFFAEPRGGGPQEQVAVSPDVVIGGDLGKIHVVDMQETDLLEVRHRDPPAALEVGVEAVLDHLPQRPLGGLPLGELGSRVLGEIGELEIERGGDRLGHDLVGETVGGRGQGVAERASQLRHLDEVVEVTSLQRGVLAVVDEGEQLAGLRVELGGVEAPQRPHDARGEDRDRRRAAFLVEGRQLREVAASHLLVGHPAAEAERERGGHEPRREAVALGHLGAVLGDEHGLG